MLAYDYVMYEHDMGPTGNVVVLWRSPKSTNAAVGFMCHDILRQHVAAQRGGGGDDDAGGHWDPASAASAARAVRICQQVQQGGGADGGVRYAHRRDKHPNRYRREPDTDWDVEEPCPWGQAHKLQHVVLLWIPCGRSHANLLLVHHMFALC